MTFRKELAELINRRSLENGSDTPDFILADYLCECLAVFDRFVTARDTWYGRNGLSASVKMHVEQGAMEKIINTVSPKSTDATRG